LIVVCDNFEDIVDSWSPKLYIGRRCKCGISAMSIRIEGKTEMLFL